MILPFVSPTRGMSRWLRALAGAMTVGLLVSTGVGPSMSECEREVRDRHWEHAAEVCLAGYERTGGAEDLKRAAEALMNWEDLDQRETRARELLDGSLRAYAEGHRILSYTLAQRGDGQQARYHAISAFVAHLLVGDERRLTSDVLLLSRAARKAGDLDTALAAAEDAISRAQRGRDPHNEFAARIALVDMLRRKGAPELAGKALTAAFACATDSCERSWAHLKKAMNHMERGQDGYLANDEDR